MGKRGIPGRIGVLVNKWQAFGTRNSRFAIASSRRLRLSLDARCLALVPQELTADMKLYLFLFAGFLDDVAEVVREAGGKLLVIGHGNVLCFFVFNLTTETQTRKRKISGATSN